MNFDNTAIYGWASDKNLSTKAAYNLVRATEDLVSAAQEAIQELEDLVARASATDGEAALGSILDHARLAGYSNVVEANVSKVRQQAGRIQGIIEASV